MQKTIRCLLSIMLTLAFLTAISNSALPQSPLKGWLIESQQDWISAPFGYRRYKIKISANPPVPVKDAVEFKIVAKQQQNGRDHSITVTPITIKEGDTSAEVEVLVNQTNDSYDYKNLQLHIENDGDLNFDPNRDLISFVSDSAYGMASEGMPSILFISTAVTNQVTKQLRTKKSLVNVASTSVFSIDDKKFPAVEALYSLYPDVNGQPVGGSNAAKKNPTALDVMESPWLHAIDPANVPRNWLALTAVEIVVVSYEDLVQVAKSPIQMEAIRKWVAAGGTLVVNNASADYKQAPRIRALVDGQVSLSARQRSPWIVPGKQVNNLDKFVVLDSSVNYIYAGNQPDQRFTSKNELRDFRRDWQTIGKSDGLATAIDHAKCKFALYEYLLGRVVVVGDDMLAWNSDDWKHLLNASMLEGRTIRERFGSTKAAVPVDDFAIQGVGKPPVKEFQYLIGLFVLAIGPISYVVLKRKRRLQLLFLTVPAISLIACVSLVMYALLSDGFQNRGRMRSFTTIDHSRQRAVSFVRHSQYAGVQPDDYHFDNDEAVFNGRAWSSPRTVIRQHPTGVSVNGGDIRPRMPHQIISIRNYDSPKRLALLPPKSPGEPPGVQNQFDNPVRFAIMRTGDGYFFVENVAAGDTVVSQEISVEQGKLGSTAAGRKLITLLEEISPKVQDDFFARSAYTTDPFYYYGYNQSVGNETALVECDYQLAMLRTNLDSFFEEPGQYVAILEEYSGVPAPQPDIDYKNKLNIIHGIW